MKSFVIAIVIMSLSFTGCSHKKAPYQYVSMQYTDVKNGVFDPNKGIIYYEKNGIWYSRDYVKGINTTDTMLNIGSRRR